MWASSLGISIPRASWLLSCPKHTRGSIKPISIGRHSAGPDAYLCKINGTLYFRINRIGLQLIERCPQTKEEARAYRDRRVVELGLRPPTDQTK